MHWMIQSDVFYVDLQFHFCYNLCFLPGISGTLLTDTQE
uniref:Uncharacterized protein n=1 Tax=Arundo donax TaxID=35708 RepID=A0A0A9GS52_ARUDO